jgi:hypothetical protein
MSATTFDSEKKDNRALPEIPGIHFVDYVDESQLDYVMSLVGRDLSEPYSSKSYVV